MSSGFLAWFCFSSASAGSASAKRTANRAMRCMDWLPPTDGSGRLGFLGAKNDDPAAGEITEINAVALGRRGDGDVLAAAGELRVADKAEELAAGAESFHDPF